MKKYLSYIPLVLLALLILAIFKQWFLPGLVSGGDFWPFYKSMYSIRPIYLYAWDWSQGMGLGGFSGALLWIYLTFGIPITLFGIFLGLSWIYIERLYFLYPFIIFNLFTSYFLFKKLFNNNFAYLSSAIYALNTYVLMMAGGGQMGVGLAYSIAPLVVLGFIKVFDLNKFSKQVIKSSLFSAIIFSAQIIFDLRIAYITLIAVFVYWIVSIIKNWNTKHIVSSFLFGFVIPGIVSLFLNVFWILPTILNKQNPLAQFGQAYTSLNAVKFFSFAKFENSISLLHPNWPENIFGKVGFMKPEFLLLPILAYASLLFVSRIKDQKSKIYILYFALLGLIGGFLAKGANEPFGGIYLWMFNHSPGFIMFRDPTKWYALVAISYSILIPFSIWKIYELLGLRSQFSIFYFKFPLKFKFLNVSKIFLILTSLFLILLIRPALMDQLTGTFKPTSIPNDYVRLEKFLSSQNNFSRTLWVPTNQRFGFYSSTHPVVPASDFFNIYDNTKLVQKIASSESILGYSSIKYVIVPFDSQGEIFLKDRKYNENLYENTVRDISSISYLKKVGDFGKIIVYEVSNPKNHFWTTSQSLNLKYQYISPVEYKIEVENAKKGDLIVFSENYDAMWSAQGSKYKIQSTKFDNRFNSFILPQDGNYSLRIYYTPQDYVNMGLVISGFTLILVISVLIYLRKKEI